MIEDMYTSTLGPLCAKCGQEERKPGSKWCQPCLDAPRLLREAYLRGAAEAAMQYTDPSLAVAPPRPVSKPTGPCPRCQIALWVDRGNEVWGCGSCGFQPGESGAAPPIPAPWYGAGSAPA